ncbi:MAG: VanZ family protein [Flavobacteriaceae bacterium]
MLNSYKFTLAFILWMALITFLSLFSFSNIEEVDFQIPYLDKAVHFLFYFIAAFLCCFFIRERTRGKFSFRPALVYTAFFMVLFGLAIEVIQSVFTTYRSGEILDSMANLIGVLAALLFVNYLFSPKTGLKWRY